MNNRLKVIRAVQGVTQFKLYLKTKINAGKISLIENDLIQPSEAEKQKLSRALGVKPEEIFPEAR